jgi:peptide/nickel transport system substrate-binding protein
MMDPKRSILNTDFPAYSGVQKVDDSTVKITLKYPSPSYLLNLAAPYSVIQPKHLSAVDNKSTDFIIGTGPFKFKNYTKDSQFDLVRNPDYFKKDKAGNQLPYLDGISLYIMPVAAGFNAFLANRLDMANPATGIGSPDSLRQVKEQVPSVVLFKTPTGSQPYIWSFNFKNPLFKDARIRQAISLMFDPTEQAMARSGNTDFLDLTRGFFPPAWGLPAAEIAKTMMWDQPLDKRFAEAKRLVKEAGYTGGLKVRIILQQIGTTSGGGIPAGAAVALDHMKKELNIDGEIVGLPPAEYAKARQDGNWDMLSAIIVNTIGDPDAHMAYFITGSPSNPGGYSNPDVDKMWDQQSREMDAAKRRDILLQLERKLLTELPSVPGYFQLGYKQWYPYVKNVRYATSVYAANIRMQDVWISK